MEDLDHARDLHRRGLLSQAQAAYDNILVEHPEQAEALHLRGLTAHQLGNNAEALEWVERAMDCASIADGLFNTLGSIYEAIGRGAEALSAFEKAVAADPNDPDALSNLAATIDSVEGPTPDSLRLHMRALAADPNHAVVRNNLANALVTLGRPDAALPHRRAAVEIAPTIAALHVNLGNTLGQLGQTQEALDAYRRSIAVDPTNAAAQSALALILEQQNQLTEAGAAAQEAVRLRPTDVGGHLVLARLALRRKDPETCRQRAHDALAAAADAHQQSHAINLLGRAADQAGDYDAAYAAFEQSNRLAAQSPAGRALADAADRWLGNLRRINQALTPERIGRWQAVGPEVDDHRAHAFLVGFPRSGTTLLENVLAAHPGITTVDERPTLQTVVENFVGNDALSLDWLDNPDPERFAAIRADYWRTAEHFSGEVDDGTMLLDKMPLDSAYLPLIYRFFPRAKIIVALRDPRDVCLSNLMQAFALNPAMLHFTDAESTVDLYETIMGAVIGHMRDPHMALCAVRYEDVVGDLESEAQEVIAFLDLPWDPQVLAYRDRAQQRAIRTPSSSQVVQPIYGGSVHRWQRYGSALDASNARLEPFAEAFGYPAKENAA